MFERAHVWIVTEQSKAEDVSASTRIAAHRPIKPGPDRRMPDWVRSSILSALYGSLPVRPALGTAGGESA